MDSQVDIFSYHYDQPLKLRSVQRAPKSADFTKTISHFSPILQRVSSVPPNLSTRQQTKPLTTKPTTSKTKATPKKRNPSGVKAAKDMTMTQNSKEKSSCQINDSVLIKLNSKSIPLPTINRPSRTRERSSLVPHLYAEQRVRERSKSQEAPQKPLPKDVRKVVAFGRTTTVEDGKVPPVTRSSSATASGRELACFRSDLEHLRKRICENESLQTEVAQMQKLVNDLQAAKNARMMEQKRENHKLHDEIASLRINLDAMAAVNADLKRRIVDLEQKSLKKLAKESKPKGGWVPTSVKSSECKTATETVSELKPSDQLYTFLPPSTNRQIRQISNQSVQSRHNNTGHDILRQGGGRFRSDNISYFDFDTSRRSRQANFKENISPSGGPKTLASNQIIDLNDTCALNDDEFRFDAE